MVKRDFPQIQKHSNRVIGYRVCQLILCHNNILMIDESQSLQVKQLGQDENSIVKNVKKKNIFVYILLTGTHIKQLKNGK